MEPHRRLPPVEGSDRITRAEDVARAGLLGRRLHGHKLTRSNVRRAADVVAWLGAVQSQDYPGAKWALGLRAPGLTDDAVEQAFTHGEILRTHVLRPTWHFVTPADIRWMLALTGPRINAGNTPAYRRFGLDDATLKRARGVLDRTLGKGGQLTRTELGAALGSAGIPVTGVELAHVMMNAELEGVICSGGRQGKQSTYALLDARAPRGRIVTRDEALGELARRYFTSHGPATMRDYVWWSGLVVSDARRGIEIAGRALERRTICDRSYWSAPASATRTAARGTSEAHMLPNYDEYLVAYRDREPGSDIFAPVLIIDGRPAGSWTRVARRDGVTLNVVSYRRLTPGGRRALAAAAERYGRFMNQAVTCVQDSR